MKTYELITEDINPCGGERYARKLVQEIRAEDPAAYMATLRGYPLQRRMTEADGSETWITGDGRGNVVRFTFSEIPEE